MHRHSPLAAVFIVVGASLALSACAAPPVPPVDDSAASTDHGAVDGAREMSEPQSGIAFIEANGSVGHLDLLDGSRTELGSVPPPTGSTSDGRYVFSHGRDGVSVVDSGRWTWDHVDHFHYYLAEPRMLGTVAGRGPASVATTTSSTSGGTGLFFAESGEAVLLDTRALSEGEIVESFRIAATPHDGLLVPVGAFALLTTASGGVVTSIVVLDHDGTRVPGAVAECREARGTITTRVGAVVGCADGALLATVVDGAVELEKIPYPAGTTAARAQHFAGREGRPTVAAIAGGAGIWLLDTRARSWTLLPTDAPVVAVTAVDDERGHVLALSPDGSLLVIDAAAGTTLSRTEPLIAASPYGGTSGAALFTDQSRAYVAAPADGMVYEIDFADSARIARTFEIPPDTAFVAGTGR